MRLAKAFAATTLALMLGFALAHCGSSGDGAKADAGCDSATDPACAPEVCDTDEDCGDPRLFLCNKDGACVPACAAKADCANTAVWTACSGPLGCNCDERKCVPQACTADSECGTQVCKNGQCVAPDTDADGCRIFPDSVAMRVGQQASFTAVAYKGSAPVSLGANAFTWGVADGSTSVEKVSDGVFRGKAASGASAAIKATTKTGVSCTARATVYGEVPAGSGRVVVIDELTGRPVTGAQVMFGAKEAPAEASAAGAYVATGVTPPVTVSVFHRDFGYVTVVGTGKTDLLIPLRRHAADKSGGFKGKFQNFPQSQIAVGIAGTSIPGSFTDLQFDVIVGPTEDTPITFSGSTFNAPLPSGVALGIGPNRFKEEYRALGVAGVCDVEAEVLAGDCGTRTAWSLMGEVPISAAVPLVNDYQAGTGLNAGKAIGLIVPYVKGFKSAVARDVGFKLSPGAPDYGKFVQQDFKPEIALTLKQTVAVPELPKAGDTTLDGALVLAGALVPGRGLVPLGITAGTDTDDQFKVANGKVIGVDIGADGQKTSKDDGNLVLRMAPNHGGIEGSRYGVVTLAIPTTGALPDGAIATTGLVDFRQSMPHGTKVEYPGFLGFPIDATSKSAGHYAYRSGLYTGGKNVAGASLHRVVFSAKDGRRWTVYVKDLASFQVPEPPTGFDDWTMSDGKPRGASPDSVGSPVIVQAIKAADASGPIDLDKLVEFNGTNADRLVEYTSAFSVYERDVTVGFVEPAGCETRCPVPGAQAFKVRVTGFQVPAEGKIELIADGDGQKKAVIGTLTDWEGSARFDPALAAGDHTITARLVGTDGTPIDPKVEAKIDVKVE